MSGFTFRLAALVDELKRRGVLRVAAVYLVGAWLLIQVSDITFPRLGLPDWTVTFVIITGALAFPVVIALAWAFDFTTRGLERTSPREEQLLNDGVVVPAIVRRPHGTVAAAALMAIPLIGFGLWWVNDARGFSLDANLVVITPFRVAGASPEAQYLREGLMDLIAARIGGAGSDLTVVAPRTVSRTLRDQLGSLDVDPDQREALALARELGAGRLLEGEVVGSGNRVTVTASLYDVFSGNRIGDPTTIATHPDSIHGLVDELAARLVAAGSGVAGDQLAHLTTSSLPALRLFLAGEAAFRRGQHAEALRSYDQAVSLDTTFALAALGLLRAQGWAPGSPAENNWGRAETIVERGIDRLSEADRLYFEAFTGGGGRSLSQRVTLRMRAAERAPDAAELRYLAGDGLFHLGAAIGIADAQARARELFEQTVAMDSAYLEPLIHLYDMAVFDGDTAGARRWGAMLLAIDSTGSYAVAVRYGHTRGFAGAALAGDAIGFDTLTTPQLLRISAPSGFSPEEAVVTEILRRFDPHTKPDEAQAMTRAINRFGLRGGRPSMLAITGSSGRDTQWDDLERLTLALYWLRDADSVRIASAAARDGLVRVRARPDDADGVVLRECMLGHAALSVGDVTAGASRAAALDQFTVSPAESDWLEDIRTGCASFLRAGVAVYGGAPDAMRRLELLDDTLALGIPGDQYLNQIFQLGVARLWEHVGRPERALAAVRRRIYLPWAALWHTEMYGEEARLAEQVGERDAAIDAYRRYLANLEHAEAPFRQRADAAAQRLASLVGERGR